MKTYVIKEDACYGCMACYNICPNEAIDIVENEEGFLFPAINIKRCTHCNLCQKVCPSYGDNRDLAKEQRGYVAQNSDVDIRMSSTSGGVFGALVSWCISQGGIVFGAMLDDSMKVVHSFSDNIEDAVKFRGSKYVQSDIGRSYVEAKKFLEQDKYVLFSGTPCQIEGLLSFLDKKYKKLITMDVVCRGVLSPGIFRKYLQFQEHSLKQAITNVRFREKRWGYKYTAMAIYSGDKCIYAKGTESDALLRAFFENNYDRLSCSHCQFKKQYRNSDITIWDCFNANLYYKKFDDDRGTNKILVHTENGKNLIENLEKNNRIFVQEVPVKMLIRENTESMFESIIINDKKRNNFFEDYKKMSSVELWKKHYPDNFKIKIKRLTRKLLFFTGTYQAVKRMKNRYCKKVFMKICKTGSNNQKQEKPIA